MSAFITLFQNQILLLDTKKGNKNRIISILLRLKNILQRYKHLEFYEESKRVKQAQFSNNKFDGLLWYFLAAN